MLLCAIKEQSYLYFAKTGFIPALCDVTRVYLRSVSASCGSCYSFASMGMLEARIRILTNNSQTPILSPQQVVSCSEYSQGKLPHNVKYNSLLIILFRIGQQLNHVNHGCFYNVNLILEKCRTAVCKQLRAAFPPNQNK